MNNSRGFTLVELMVVITVFGIVSIAAIPGVTRFLQSWKLSGEIDQLASAMRTARSAAVMKNINTVFEFDEDTNTYSYFEDVDGDGDKDASEYESATYELTAGIYIESHTFSETSITFGPKGNANESGAIVITNSHNSTRSINLFGGTGNIEVD